MSQVTRILKSLNAGDARAVDELLPTVYSELRRLARAKMAREAPGHTLQPTALVHEAYLKLFESGEAGWKNRGHFFAAAAEAMRRILVDNARRKRRLKRDGHSAPAELIGTQLTSATPDDKLLLVNEALDHFTAHAPHKAEVVKLRYFAGLSYEETAAALSLSERTVRRHWVYAKAWLTDFIEHELRGDRDSPGTR